MYKRQIAFSGKAIIVKLGLHLGADAVTLLALRMLVALPLFLLMGAWASRRAAPLSAADRLRVFALGVSGYYLASLLDFLGLAYISATLERVILYLTPTFVLLLGAMLARRRPTRTQAAALAISYAGVALAFGHDLQMAGDQVLKGGLLAVSYTHLDVYKRQDKYLAELARAVRERGGEIVEGCALHGLREDREGVVAYTDHGEERARNAVLALGAWSALSADALGLPWLKRVIQPGKGYSITYRAPALLPKRPLVLRERSVCVTSWADGFRLGSTMEFSGFDRTLNARRLGALERGAREYLREPVGPEIRERWYGWRPMSRDDMPLIGRAPGLRRVWMLSLIHI